MSYDLNFLEACKALDEKKCTEIENEFGIQYTVNNVGLLSPASDPQNGVKRTPGGFLVNWKLVDKVPVMHEKIIENVTWNRGTGNVVYPFIYTQNSFTWGDLIGKPKMQVTLRWKESTTAS